MTKPDEQVLSSRLVFA